MSEYQYYEFQALDRPLTEVEMDELRSCSTRAAITASRFVNHYEWGNFKGDPSLWMEKYFDAFLYLANWGTHELCFRLPRRVLDLETAKQYCCGEAASARLEGEFVILEFLSQEEDGGDGGWDDGNGWLSSLIPLRADLAAGDHRALYLAWLLCVHAGDLKDDATEPPVPPGLGNLTAPLQAFADFLSLDDDLLRVAAARSPEAETSLPSREIEQWIAAWPEAEKTAWLVRLAQGGEPHLRAELLRRFRDSQTNLLQCEERVPRTVGELLAAADQRAEERRRRNAEQAAKERARREQEASEARARYFADLAKREIEVWRKVDALVATKQPGKYDEAVKLLCDLRDLALQEGRPDEFETRLLQIREAHTKKPSFLQRLEKGGLGQG